YLTKFASKVYLIHRRDKLRASKAMQDRAFKNSKIQFVWNQEVISIDTQVHKTTQGMDVEKISGLQLKDTQTGRISSLLVEGLFVAIGHSPNTSLFKDALTLDESGYIRVTPGTTKTNIPGVFACGDVQDKVFRQAITAAGSGCMAAIETEHYLSSIGLVD
ncbi:MAG: FAD-dependent oxidoreductase, partial [Holophagaceae bacterium]